MKQYIVDAFAETVFSGNPAAVCIPEKELPDRILQNITRENNLSETAFLTERDGRFHLRWFTPGGEIDLCGHATLATAFIVTRFIRPGSDIVQFDTRSGILTVEKKNGLFEMDFPAYPLEPVPVTDEMVQAIGARPLEAWLGRDLLCIMEDEQTVRSARPDPTKLLSLDGLLLHISAMGENHDCVSRSFAPKMNVDEDPVCGSGHCHIFPYWAKRLGKTELTGYQASSRGGILYGQASDDRVLLGGKAVLFSAGDIFLPELP